jgi:hypothetical protein
MSPEDARKLTRVNAPRPLPPLEYILKFVRISTESPSGLKFNHTKLKCGSKQRGTTGLYWRVKVGAFRYQAHRVVWAIHNGKDPFPYFVDHKDGNTLNNEPENLRICTRNENGWNRVVNKNNQAGLKGVFPDGGKWRAKIQINGKRTGLGTFDSKEKAKHAYDEFAKREHSIFFKS